MGRARVRPLRRSVCAPLGWLGRHSLGIYLLHRPVIYGVLLLLFHVFEAVNLDKLPTCGILLMVRKKTNHENASASSGRIFLELKVSVN